MAIIKILKSENIGNTFSGLVFSAFEATDFDAPAYMQNPREGMGTICVDGEWFDWYDRGECVEFMEAK